MNKMTVEEVRASVAETLKLSPLHCPMCKQPLKLHGVATLQEEHECYHLQARSSVNAQLYAEVDKGPFMPMSVMAETLPPVCEHVRDYLDELKGGSEDEQGILETPKAE